MLGSDDLAFFTIKNVDTTELFAFGGLLLYYCLYAFGESLFACPKSNPKTHASLMLRKGSAGRRTTVRTIQSLTHFDYSFSLMVQL
jgi:hypothetical protein